MERYLRMWWISIIRDIVRNVGVVYMTMNVTVSILGIDVEGRALVCYTD